MEKILFRLKERGFLKYEAWISLNRVSTILMTVKHDDLAKECITHLKKGERFLIENNKPKDNIIPYKMIFEPALVVQERVKQEINDLEEKLFVARVKSGEDFL